jgi:CRISPR-associated protein Csd2
MPRIDVETDYGIVTDVCLKRKIRNYVDLTKSSVAGFEIYIKDGLSLESKQNKIEVANGESKKEAMCKKYFDIRTFGAVLAQLQKNTTKTKKDKKTAAAEVSQNSEDAKVDSNNGQVRGPVQINFSKSIDQVFPTTTTITRLVDEKEDNKTTMGTKHIIPYALYKAEGYVSAKFAQKTGFSTEDLELFWEALENMFEHDHSAARGKMAVRKLVIFKHASELGNAPAHKLFELIDVRRKDASKPARSFADYEITINKSDKPNQVEIIEKV